MVICDRKLKATHGGSKQHQRNATRNTSNFYQNRNSAQSTYVVAGVDQVEVWNSGRVSYNMGQLGCSLGGQLDESKFSEPLPWIGIYIAAASLVCGAAMATDAAHGFYRRKFWFPCKYFTLNATTLTLISVASKLGVDLNTPMPSRKDQLSKLSSTVLILIVNIGIQLATGVIYVFWKEHAFIMSLMLLLFAVPSFTALVVPTTKVCLEIEYKKRRQFAPKVNESPNENEKSLIENLRECLVRHWIMALTCTPQFMISRSVTCTASSALCILSAVTLAEAMLRAHLMSGSFKFSWAKLK